MENNNQEKITHTEFDAAAEIASIFDDAKKCGSL